MGRECMTGFVFTDRVTEERADGGDCLSGEAPELHVLFLHIQLDIAGPHGSFGYKQG